MTRFPSTDSAQPKLTRLSGSSVVECQLKIMKRHKGSLLMLLVWRCQLALFANFCSSRLHQPALAGYCALITTALSTSPLATITWSQ